VYSKALALWLGSFDIVPIMTLIAKAENKLTII
jgi:hypothetical protein